MTVSFTNDSFESPLTNLFPSLVLSFFTNFSVMESGLNFLILDSFLPLQHKRFFLLMITNIITKKMRRMRELLDRMTTEFKFIGAVKRFIIKSIIWPRKTYCNQTLKSNKFSAIPFFKTLINQLNL